MSASACLATRAKFSLRPMVHMRVCVVVLFGVFASHFRRSSTGFKYVVRNAGADLLLPAYLVLSRSVLEARLSAVNDRVLGREGN